MESTFSDPVTAYVVGIDTLLASFRPRSEWGRRVARRTRAFRPGDSRNIDQEIVSLRAVEAWAADVHVDEDLQELPPLDRPLELLESDEALDDAALFELKRFLFHGARIVRAATGLADIDPRWSDLLAELLEEIQPGGSNRARFRLVGTLDERLPAARTDAKAARSAHRTLRDELEAAIIGARGGTFDIRGRYLPADDAEMATVAAEDSLRATADGFVLDSPELAAALEAVREAEAAVASVEDDVRARLSDVFRSHIDLLEEVRRALGELDVRIAKVEMRRDIDGCWAEASTRFAIRQGRHPRIAEDAQPIDVELPVERATVVTGPNMGGKSNLLELVGLCQWAAQHAFPVPAESFHYVPVDRIAYVGAEEGGRPADAGLSSFGREVRRVVDLLSAGGRTLWLFDEFGRGTHPDEGAKLAAELHAARVAAGDLVVAATHFPTVAADRNAHHLRIAGLVGLDALDGISDDAALMEIEATLREAMDYQPVEVRAGTDIVPRDARRIARALGLVLGDD